MSLLWPPKRLPHAGLGPGGFQAPQHLEAGTRRLATGVHGPAAPELRDHGDRTEPKAAAPMTRHRRHRGAAAYRTWTASSDARDSRTHRKPGLQDALCRGDLESRPAALESVQGAWPLVPSGRRRICQAQEAGTLVQGAGPLVPSVRRRTWGGGGEPGASGSHPPPKPQASAGAPGSCPWSGLMRSSPGLS